jgi:hypothetical protein
VHLGLCVSVSVLVHRHHSELLSAVQPSLSILSGKWGPSEDDQDVPWFLALFLIYHKLFWSSHWQEDAMVYRIRSWQINCCLWTPLLWVRYLCSEFISYFAQWPPKPSTSENSVMKHQSNLGFLVPQHPLQSK